MWRKTANIDFIDLVWQALKTVSISKYKESI